jgi:hypothetical protein
MTKKRLGELLIEAGYIKDEQLQQVLAEQRKTGELLGEVLVRLGMVTEENIAQTLVAQFGIPFMRASQYFISKDMAKLFPEAMLNQYMFVPVDRIGNVLVIISAGLLNQDIVNELERATGCKVQAYIGIQSDVRKAIQKHFHAESDETPVLSSLGSLLLDEGEEPAAVAEDAGGNNDLSIDDSPIFGTSDTAKKPPVTAVTGKTATSSIPAKTITGGVPGKTAPSGITGKTATSGLGGATGKTATSGLGSATGKTATGGLGGTTGRTATGGLGGMPASGGTTGKTATGGAGFPGAPGVPGTQKKKL